MQAACVEWREDQRIVHSIHDGIAELGDFKKMDRRLYQVLAACTKGEAKNCACNSERSGFKAWEQMVSHIEPRTGADTSVAYSRVTPPVSQSGLKPARLKTPHSARGITQRCRQEVAEFEMKHAKKVDEDAKVLAPKSIMLGMLSGEEGVFRGRSFNLYVDLRTAIINFLDHDVPVSMMKQSLSISKTNMVQSLTAGEQGEQGEDENVKNEVTQDEIFAMFQQLRKCKGQGRSKGKKGACWNCGDSDHCTRDCPNDKQDDSWTDGGTRKEESDRQQGRQRCRQSMGRRHEQVE